jgi:hypothetical protein
VIAMKNPTRIRRFHAAAVSIVAAATLAVAPQHAVGQTAGKTDFRQGTALAGFIGAASTASRTEAAVGGAIAWELTPHFAVEGRGFWLDAAPRANAFAALLGARIPLLPDRPVVPFMSAGAGLYRATFDGVLPAVPRFYQRRMIPRTGGWAGRSFDDFALAFGGGVDVLLSQHLALRPELTVLLITTRSHAHAVPVFGAQLAYHFESHPLAPSAR